MALSALVVIVGREAGALVRVMAPPGWGVLSPRLPAFGCLAGPRAPAGPELLVPRRRDTSGLPVAGTKGPLPPEWRGPSRSRGEGASVAPHRADAAEAGCAPRRCLPSFLSRRPASHRTTPGAGIPSAVLSAPRGRVGACRKLPAASLLTSNCQAVSALQPARLQYCSPGSGRHAVAEPMSLRPAPGVRLERTFHWLPPR
jgi:hypothetical protein